MVELTREIVGGWVREWHEMPNPRPDAEAFMAEKLVENGYDPQERTRGFSLIEIVMDEWAGLAA